MQMPSCQQRPITGFGSAYCISRRLLLDNCQTSTLKQSAHEMMNKAYCNLDLGKLVSLLSSWPHLRATKLLHVQR